MRIGFLFLATTATSTAFVVQPSASSSSTTALYISSWGVKGPPAFRTMERENPAEKVQAYLKAPEPVEARSTIDGTCLVSGLIRPGVTADDQFLFDLLNHQDSAFEFDKIVAFCPDTKLAKKQLISRSARYTGLLNKLDFAQGDSLPTAAQLDGVKSWLAYLQGDDLLEQVQTIAKTLADAPSVENIAILLVGANELDVTASAAALEAIQNTGKTYSIAAVGQLTDEPEGKQAYHFDQFGTVNGTLPAKAIFSRQESYRMITEMLQLEAGANKAFSFAEIYNVNATEVRLIRGLREAGYARLQEIDHMLRDGAKNYEKAIEEWLTSNPDAAKGYTTNAWWEQEQFQKSRRKSDERFLAEQQQEKDERTKEIEAIANEWVKREYFRQSMAGTVENDMTEAEFKETVWDRALLEGDLKYRIKMGEVVDEEMELADFKKRQERKQQELLKKAKKELAEVLGEEIPDDDDDKKDA
ncbi:hypothetical protein FisN_7Hh236 [Fistulifera solaris]|uniref:VWFA domain-containing protein n=1 Tax=Fistulifera solaris TaxID=1519565 RepID=A0A1Z5KS73_FISSO|nr:hypothetical protein FisN_7Hh236 [Fistulifera solaris]|eukprot:GAX29163.1 hypothetical protein FisN_7Hh236 [Fistulifera solaris]